MTAQLDVDQARAEAQLRRDLRAADRAAAAEAREAKRAEKHQATEQRRAWRRDRRQRRRAALAELGRRLRPAAPIALVTALAMYGQVAYAYAEIAPPWWMWPLRIVLALAIGIAFESISLTVQWHAHDSLLRGHTLTAARQRRVSYLLAIGGGVVNYSHFAGPGWSPTPAAVCFFAFSAAGPWLWGLHTRRAHQVQLSREGQLDTGGAVFSAERYRWFPWRTFGALRWSIDHGITDPRAAWVGYNAERSAARAARDARRATRRGRRRTAEDGGQDEGAPEPDLEIVPTALVAPTPSQAQAGADLAAGAGTVPDGGEDQEDDGEDELPDRTTVVNTANLAAVAADLRTVRDEMGRRPTRDEVKQIYRISSERASQVLRYLVWGTPSSRQDEAEQLAEDLAVLRDEQGTEAAVR